MKKNKSTLIGVTKPKRNLNYQVLLAKLVEPHLEEIIQKAKDLSLLKNEDLLRANVKHLASKDLDPSVKNRKKQEKKNEI